MANEFEQLDRVLSQLISRSQPAQRRKLGREIARDLRQGQQQRIHRQVNSNGSAYTARRPRVRTVQKRLRFIYQGKVRDLKNWSGNKRQITGWDNERNAVRTFNRAGIERFIAVETAPATKRTSKKSPMFRRLRTARFLRTTSTADSASVGFSGVAASIAKIHQYGLRDKVNPHITVDYPARELLGITRQDSEKVRDQVFDFIART